MYFLERKGRIDDFGVTSSNWMGFGVSDPRSDFFSDILLVVCFFECSVVFSSPCHQGYLEIGDFRFKVLHSEGSESHDRQFTWRRKNNGVSNNSDAFQKIRHPYFLERKGRIDDFGVTSSNWMGLGVSEPRSDFFSDILDSRGCVFLRLQCCFFLPLSSRLSRN